MPDLIDELLELVGLTADDVGQDTPVTASVNDSDKRLAQIRKLQSDFERLVQVEPLGATAAQREELNKLHFLFMRLATMHDTDIGHLKLAFDEYVKRDTEIRNELRKPEALRKRLLGSVEAAVPKELAKDIVAGAMPTESEPLAQRREKLVALLAPLARGKPHLPNEDLQKLLAEVQQFGAAVEGLRDEIERRRVAREQLRRDLAEVGAIGVVDPEQFVPGATAQDVRPIVDGIAEVAKVIDDASSTLVQLNEQSSRIGTLKARKGSLSDAVEDRAARRLAVLRQVEEVDQALPKEANDEALSAVRTRITLALERRPLAEEDVRAAELALPELRAGAEAEAEDVRERQVRRAALRRRVEETLALIDQTCDGYKVGSVTAQLKKLTRTLEAPLHTIKFDALESMPIDIVKELNVALESGLTNFKANEEPPLTDYLKRSSASLAAEALQLKPFVDFLGAQALDEVVEQNEQVQELVDPPVDPVETPTTPTKGNKKPPSTAKSKSPPEKPRPKRKDIDAAFLLIAQMHQAVEDARQAAGDNMAALSALRDSLLERVRADSPPGLPEGFDRILEERRDAVRNPLGKAMSPDVTDPVIKAASKHATRFEQDLKAAAALAQAWADVGKQFKTVHNEARSPLQAEMTRRYQAVLDAGTAAADKADMAAAVRLAEGLLAYLKRAAQEAGKSADTKKALAEVDLGGRKLDAKTIDLVFDLAGPDATALDAAGLKTLCTCFDKADPAARGALTELVSEGFGGEGQLLLGLVRSSDPEAILALAKGLGGGGNQADRKHLRGLVVDGGFGEAPQVLDDLLSFGVGATLDEDKTQQRADNVARLKALGKAFGDKDGPSRMKTLMVDCGLGKPRPEEPPRPGIMAELLNGPGGLAGDAAELRKFADGFADEGPAGMKDRARLKGLVEEGGFGNRPKAFAPLVKQLATAKNGMAGAVATLKEVGRQFEKPLDRGRLKALLEGGGMSGDTQDPHRGHEHPETLGQVFVEGLGGRADKLKEFTDAFGDTPAHTEEARHMLEAWNEFPDSLSKHRKPGDKIKRLLGPGHFNGDVSKLQARFTSRMEQFNDPAQRKRATRFAPHFDKKAVSQKDESAKPNPMPQGVKTLGVWYMAQRHLPTFAKNGYRNPNTTWLAADNSYFPVDTDCQALVDMIGEAMQQNGAIASNETGTKHLALANGLTVEVGWRPDGVIVHCFPVSGKGSPDPGEVAKFTKAESERIFAAVAP